MSFLLPNAKSQFIDNNGAPLVGGFVYFYIPNTSTPKNTYQDEALTILNTNPIVLDARGEATIWGTGAYRQVLRDSNGNLIWDGVITDPSGAVADLQESLETGALYYLTNIGGTGDAITASASFTFTALTEGMTFWFKCKTPNSASTIPTISINGGAPVSITGIGQMIGGQEYQIIFDGTNFQGQNPNQPSALVLYTTGGTAPAYTLTVSPSPTSYTKGLRYNVQFNAAGTSGSNTLTIGSLAAQNLKQYDSSGGKIPAVIAVNQISDVEYDGTDFIVLDALSDAQVQSLSASVSLNALTVTYAGGVLDFRNATRANGSAIRLPTPSNSITVPSGATLGTVSNEAARLIFLEAYNGGTPILCVVNAAGGLQLDETNLISPTTISAAATAANVIYSASTVSANSPYRIVGFCDVTETTAGTWATAPSFVQGVGGFAGIPNGIGGAINNTSASADIALQFGQSAYIDVSAATSVPLHISTGDNQVYELTLALAGNTGASSPTLLNPNNTTYPNFFVYTVEGFFGTTVSSASGYASGFLLDNSTDIRLARTLVSTKTTSKNVISTQQGFSPSVPGQRGSMVMSTWLATASTANGPSDTTTLWTSLGTIVFPVAATGRISIRRIA